MTATTNADRAETAMRIIDHFCDPFASDLKLCITDLMGNLLHLANSCGMNTDEIMEKSIGDFIRQIAQDCDGEPSQYLAVRIAVLKEAA